MNTFWQPCAQLPTLSDEAVIVFRGQLDDFVEWVPTLSEPLIQEELARAERFRFPELKNHFLIVRGWLRLLLGHYAGASFCMSYGAQGKPLLVDSDVTFNVSHSGQWFLIAVGQRQPLGVDVEQYSDREYLMLAKRFFAKPEYEALLQTSAEKRAALFFQIWVQKEAFIKATGLGIQFGLELFQVSFGSQAGIQAIKRAGYNPLDWQLQFCPPANGYAGAIAHDASIKILHGYTLSVDGLMHLTSNA